MTEYLILDRSHEPTMEEIASYIKDCPRRMWQDMTDFLKSDGRVKQQIAYSICSGKPGWNVKYKRGGKALCTLYPEKDCFIALIVLGQDNRDTFDIVRESYCGYITELYDKCTLFNGTKWLMINVTDEGILDDVKKLMALKGLAAKHGT